MDTSLKELDIRRLGTTFHRTFALNRPAVVQVLDIVYNSDSEVQSDEFERKVLRELTNLGSIYVEAMPRYGVGCGLLGWGNFPTVLGELARQHDPLLENSSTQWLMHYHLSAPQGPGPIFWHELVTTRFRSGDEFTLEDLSVSIAEIYQRCESEPLAERSARATSTIFVGTYTKPDGLGNLGLLEKLDESRYRVRDDFEPIPTWAVAYAVLDFWKANHGGRIDVLLNDLTQQLGAVLLIGAGKLANVLYKMQAEGIVIVDQSLPPYKVRLLRPEIEPVLKRLYAHE